MVSSETIAGMFWDIVISVALAALAVFAAYLGVRVTIHPPLMRHKWRYNLGFVLIGIVTAILLVVQGIRNGKAQEKAIGSINKIEGLTRDVEQGKTDIKTLGSSLQIEVARREQAERDLTLTVQKTGQDTRSGVAEDIRKSPISVTVAPLNAPAKITPQVLKRPSETAPPYETQFMVLTDKMITPVRLIIDCDRDMIDIIGRIVGAGVQMSGGGGRISSHQYEIGIDAPAWTPTSPLSITVHSNDRNLGNCRFGEQ